VHQRPAGDDTFFYRAVEAEVHFVKDEKGTVTGLEIHRAEW
jgi:hypothetical protein